MLIGIGKDPLVHVLEGSIHGNHQYFRGHGMALFLVFFNRCRVPLFPVRESPSALSERARILMSGWLFKFLRYAPCIFIFLKAQTHSSVSSLVLFQVQSLFNKKIFLSHFSFC